MDNRYVDDPALERARDQRDEAILRAELAEASGRFWVPVGLFGWALFGAACFGWLW